MTELKMRKKLIENTQKKYPHITDKSEIEKLAFSSEKKIRICIGAVLISASIASVVGAFLMPLWAASLVFLITAGMLACKGLAILYPLLRKKTGNADTEKKKVIDMKYLKSNDIKENVRNIGIQLIGLGLVIGFFYKTGNGSGIIFLFSFCIL